MMNNDSQCEKCEYAEVPASGSVTHTENITFVQKGKGNIICKCPHFVKNISIVNGKLQCSSFKERGEQL